MNSERPPTRQNRLKVLAVGLFIARLAKLPPSLWASMFCTPPWTHLYVSTTRSAQVFQRYRATPQALTFVPEHASELGAQAADSASRSHSRVPLPLCFTSQPTYLELSSISGALRRPRIVRNLWNTSEAGDPSETRGVRIQAQRASVGFSVNRCSSLFSLSFQSDLKTSFTEHSVAHSFPSGLFVHLLSQGEKKWPC